MASGEKLHAESNPGPATVLENQLTERKMVLAKRN
jgi:hypothetical protein